jgi:hypothetical protein
MPIRVLGGYKRGSDGLRAKESIWVGCLYRCKLFRASIGEVSQWSNHFHGWSNNKLQLKIN